MLRKKLAAGFLSAAMAVTMCMGAGMFAAAAPGDAGADAEAAVTKKLVMAEGVTIPNATFSFTAEPLTEAADQEGAVEGLEQNGPALTIADAVFSSASETASADGTKTAAQEILIRDKDGEALTGEDFPGTGVYAYSVKETSNTYTIADPSQETMVYSKAEYTVFITVASSEEGGRYIQGFTVVKTKDDAGTADETPDKVDPTPGGPEDGDGNSDLEFQNIYSRVGNTVPEEPEDPEESFDANGALSVSKQVEGALGDKNRDFTFTLTLHKSPILDRLVAQSGGTYPTYHAAIVGGSSEPIEFTFNGTEESVTKTFQLKHGQKLKFDDLPVGTTYDLQENNGVKITNYSTKISGKQDSVAFSENENVMATQGKGVGEQANYTKVVNTYNDNPITGIVENNLPFILMIGVAVIGFAAYLAVRRRRFAK